MYKKFDYSSFLRNGCIYGIKLDETVFLVFDVISLIGSYVEFFAKLWIMPFLKRFFGMLLKCTKFNQSL